ncbi:MAG: RsmG family class I SAM-dependent methyltransferase [bacterium]
MPLLPLAITYPENQFTGLDSVRKKVEAVADMAHTLGLQNVKTVRSRSEDYTGSFDILTARAVAFSDELFRNTYHLVKK